MIAYWCKSCDKVRYLSNGFLEQVFVCSTDAAVQARHVPRVGIAFRTLSLRTFDRLDCAANTKYIREFML